MSTDPIISQEPEASNPSHPKQEPSAVGNISDEQLLDEGTTRQLWGNPFVPCPAEIDQNYRGFLADLAQRFHINECQAHHILLGFLAGYAHPLIMVLDASDQPQPLNIFVAVGMDEISWDPIFDFLASGFIKRQHELLEYSAGLNKKDLAFKIAMTEMSLSNATRRRKEFEQVGAEPKENSYYAKAIEDEQFLAYDLQLLKYAAAPAMVVENVSHEMIFEFKNITCTGKYFNLNRLGNLVPWLLHQTIEVRNTFISYILSSNRGETFTSGSRVIRPSASFLWPIQTKWYAKFRRYLYEHCPTFSPQGFFSRSGEIRSEFILNYEDIQQNWDRWHLLVHFLTNVFHTEPKYIKLTEPAKKFYNQIKDLALGTEKPEVNMGSGDRLTLPLKVLKTAALISFLGGATFEINAQCLLFSLWITLNTGDTKQASPISKSEKLPQNEDLKRLASKLIRVNSISKRNLRRRYDNITANELDKVLHLAELKGWVSVSHSLVQVTEKFRMGFSLEAH